MDQSPPRPDGASVALGPDGIAQRRRRRWPVPDRIDRYFLPRPVLDATGRVMRRFGRDRRECYVWWGGYFTADHDAQIVTAICADADTEYGRIHLNTSQLTALHEQLRVLDQVLLVELHTHPPEGGGQNAVDAANPAATYRGFISIVVPDFAFPAFRNLKRTYVYEYLAANQWRELAAAEIGARFIVEETFVSVSI